MQNLRYSETQHKRQRTQLSVAAACFTLLGVAGMGIDMGMNFDVETFGKVM